MSFLYSVMSLNDEVMKVHQSKLKNSGNSDAHLDSIVALLGGIDEILAFYLENNRLNKSQLTALKVILSARTSAPLVRVPSAHDEFDVDNLLDEIEEHAHDDGAHGDGGCIFGHMQSPINLVSQVGTEQTKSMAVGQLQKNPLRFNYPSRVGKCTIMNNGHTVQVNIPKQAACALRIHGKKFTLAQFHFHTPSEHTIDSEAFDMEMHLVHVSDKGELAVLGFCFTTKQRYSKPTLALTQSRAHLVLSSKQNKSQNGSSSTPLRVTNESDEESDDMETDDEWTEEAAPPKKVKGKKTKENDFLAQFWSQLPASKTSKDIPLRGSISFDYLFECAADNFKKKVRTGEVVIDMPLFEYSGSLTTPPYTEGVSWLVSKKTHFISEQQLRKLSACWGNENNARPVQKYFGRVVSLRSKSSLKVV